MTTGQGKTDPNAAEILSCLIRHVIEIHQFFPHQTQPRGDSKTFSGLKFDSSAATLFYRKSSSPKSGKRPLRLKNKSQFGARLSVCIF